MRVLVVDDDEILCRVLAEVLEAIGIGAACITDGAAADEAIDCDFYDLRIINVGMPTILGTNLAEGIKELQPQTKTILALAFGNRALQEYARRKGLLLLSKPFTQLQPFDAVNIATVESLGKN